MSRPKLEVNDVWILSEVIPYEGSSIVGVFFDPEVAKGARDPHGSVTGKVRWTRVQNDGEDFWTTDRDPRNSQSMDAFLLLEKHPIRTK